MMSMKAPRDLADLLRATAEEPWEDWYALTRLALCDWIEEEEDRSSLRWAVMPQLREGNRRRLIVDKYGVHYPLIDRIIGWPEVAREVIVPPLSLLHSFVVEMIDPARPQTLVIDSGRDGSTLLRRVINIPRWLEDFSFPLVVGSPESLYAHTEDAYGSSLIVETFQNNQRVAVNSLSACRDQHRFQVLQLFPDFTINGYSPPLLMRVAEAPGSTGS